MWDLIVSVPDHCLSFYLLGLKLRARLGTRFKPPVFLCSPFQGGSSVVVSYCYLFLLSVFMLWISYYISDILCKF